MAFVIYNIFITEVPGCNFVSFDAQMVSYALIRKLLLTDTFHSPVLYLHHLRLCFFAIHTQ